MTYLDFNATSPLDRRVSETAQKWFTEQFGNPSSRDHALGWNAADAVEHSRQEVAKFINGISTEITFTSGATESLNTVIRGFVGYTGWETKKIVTCSTEHDAVLAPCRKIEQATGTEVEVLPVDYAGRIDLDLLKAAVWSDKEVLVILAAVNSEIGTLIPISEISRISHSANALFLCDFAQAVGKIPIDVRSNAIDLAVFSAHKMYGFKGVGTLFVTHEGCEITLDSLINGGGQERGLRGGTLNVPGIVGFGEACRIAAEEMPAESVRVRKLRDKLEQTILCQIPDAWVNGDPVNRIGNTSNIGFRGLNAKTLIHDMHDIAVSTQAACSTSQKGPSHVLKAIGLTDDEAYSCIRFSLGRFTTDAEIDYTIEKIVDSVRKLRR